MSGSRKVTFRLTSGEEGRLQDICRTLGSDKSTIVRAALRDFISAHPNEPGRSDGGATNAPLRHITTSIPSQATHNRDLPGVSVVLAESPKAVTSTSALSCPIVKVKDAGVRPAEEWATLSMPPSLDELVSLARGLGSELRKVRRLQFQRVAAATFVAMEDPENARDAQLYAELIRIGHAFGLLA